MSIAYLIEPAYVTNTGKLSGKSLRTYEIEYETPAGGGRLKYKPTGFMYTIKGGKLVKQKTTATLKGKHISSYNFQVYQSLELRSMRSWGSVLCTTPELALAAKGTNIAQCVESQRTALEESLASLNATAAQVPDISFIISEYPELFI